jgi:hypothetical protein
LRNIKVKPQFKRLGKPLRKLLIESEVEPADKLRIVGIVNFEKGIIGIYDLENKIGIGISANLIITLKDTEEIDEPIPAEEKRNLKVQVMTLLSQNHTRKFLEHCGINLETLREG